jgi:hypothetical protein
MARIMKVILTKQDFEKERKQLEDIVVKLAQYNIGILVSYDHDKHEVFFDYYDLAQERFLNSFSKKVSV